MLCSTCLVCAACCEVSLHAGRMQKSLCLSERFTLSAIFSRPACAELTSMQALLSSHPDVANPQACLMVLCRTGDAALLSGIRELLKASSWNKLRWSMVCEDEAINPNLSLHICIKSFADDASGAAIKEQKPKLKAGLACRQPGDSRECNTVKR